MEDRLDVYTSVVPADRQKPYQKDAFHAFLHYGMNTFTDMEWGDGKAPASCFNPTDQDTDQWMAALKAAGVTGVIITAKHHDGFCLWQTETTEYSVKNSPYKNGRGDVVREVSDSCRKYGLKFGFYLSPWDRNSEFYGTDKYNDFYIRQLTELLTNYGEVFCVWLDGACGSYMDGKEKQVYDFERIYKTVYELQPNACISSCGPDVRWVGNEAGYARESEWNVVPKFSFDIQTIEQNSQQADDEKFRKKGRDIVASDLGSREFLKDYDEFIWYPAEVDVSIRPGWFYHAKEDKKVRSLKNLLTIYYNSVGGNSLLLLNVPPTREGRIHENDVRRLKELGDEIRKATESPVEMREICGNTPKEGFGLKNCLTDDEACYSPRREANNYQIKLYFKAPARIDKVQLREQCDFSQRIEAFEVYATVENREVLVSKGTTVGFNRFALFQKPMTATAVRVVITQCRKEPYLESVKVYRAAGMLPKPPWYAPIVTAAHKLNYLAFITMENLKNGNK